MKMRIGFVSNSSSSSFVMITKKEHFEEVLASMDAFEQAVIKIYGKKESKFNGIDIITIASFSTAGGTGPLDYDEPDYEYPEGMTDEQQDEFGERKYEALDTLADEIKKKFGEESIITDTQDW